MSSEDDASRLPDELKDPCVAEQWANLADEAGFLESPPHLNFLEHKSLEQSYVAGDFVGAYQIVDRIGGGGRSVVYRAHQPSVENREVAVKVYHQSELADDGQTSRTELTAMVSLRHPHLPQTIDAGLTDDGRQFIVMTLVRGIPISQHVDAHQPSPKVLAGLLRPVADAINALHNQGIIHCDLKPANVLVDESHQPTVIDFDASQLPNLRRDAVRGTLGYMAPEQLRGVASDESQDAKCLPSDRRPPLTPQCDIYAFGALMYRLMSGQSPFAEHSDAGMIVATIHSKSSPPSQLVSDVDPSLKRICLKCLEKAPCDRFQSMDEVVAELDQFLRRYQPGSNPSWTGASNWLRTATVGCILASLVAALWVVSDRPLNRANPNASTVDTSSPGMPPGLSGYSQRESDQWQIETVHPRPGFMYASASRKQGKVAVVGADHWIRVFEMDQRLGRLSAMLPMNASLDTPDRRIDWHPRGDRLVACGNDNSLVLWSVDESRRITEIRVEGKFNFVRDVRFDPDGNRIAAACESGIVHLYDDAGKPEGAFAGHGTATLRVCWSPDGRLIASSDQSGMVLIWDPQTMRTVHRLNTGATSKHGSPVAVRALVWTHDGQHLLCGDEAGGVHCLNVRSGSQRSLLDTRSPVRELAISDDGDRLLVASQSLIEAELVGATHQESDSIDDGSEVSLVRVRQLADPSGDGDVGSAQWLSKQSAWLVAGRHRQLILVGDDPAHSATLGESNVSRILDLKYSPDGQWLATAGSDGHVRLFDAEGRPHAVSERSRKASGIHCVAWHPAGDRMAYGSGQDGDGVVEVRLQPDLDAAWQGGPRNLRSKIQLQKIGSHEFAHAVDALAYTRDGDRLLIGDFRGQIHVIDVSDGQVKTVDAGHESAVMDIVVGGDDWVASADAEGKLRTWQLTADGTLEAIAARQFAGGLTDLAMDPSGMRIALAGRKREVWLLQANTLAESWPRSAMAPARPGKLCWSTDGRRIACGLFGVIDAGTGELIDVTSCVGGRCVGWHPGGLVVTGSWQGELEFRRPPDYRVVRRAIQLRGGKTVEFTDNGELPEFAPGDRDAFVRVRQTASGRYEFAPL